MPPTTPAGSKGLLESLTRLTATLVAIAHNRLDLLSVDLEEYRAHLLSLVALTLATLFFLGMGIVLATFLIVAAFGEAHRVVVLGVLAGFAVTVGLAMWGYAVHLARTKPLPFAASLSELVKDRQELTSRS